MRGLGDVKAMNSRRYKTNNDAFYKFKEWRTLRLEALQRDSYLCQECIKRGIVTPADTVHHIKPLRVDSSQAMQLSNLESVCRACHNKLHKERPFDYKKKRRTIKALKDKNVLVFRTNPDIL